jgi:Protein kinase domain
MNEPPRIATAELPLAQVRQVDEACCRFEAAWKAGQRPRIEDYLGEIPEPGRRVLLSELVFLDVYHRRLHGEDPQPADYGRRFPGLDQGWLAGAAASSGREAVEELAEEFAARYRRGEHPSVSEYTDKYPELAEQIRELFPALVVMEQLGSVAGPPTGPFDPKAGEGSVPPQQLGDYRILREVGRGGMGVVYEAVQESLGRHVALKILPFHRLMDPLHLDRFRREARAAAQLHHTNIVPVFGVGEAEGIHSTTPCSLSRARDWMSCCRTCGGCGATSAGRR